MSTGQPVIGFGQQPCGFFPRRFLWAKIRKARELQAAHGGRIVFFYHDSDHDPRETQTILRDRRSGEPSTLNFSFANKIQRKYSPLYAKRVLGDWIATMTRQLPGYVESPLVEAFQRASGENVADFCLSVYREMGLLEGIEVVRSGDPAVRRAAVPVEDHFVDVTYSGETVRARRSESGRLSLHRGGDSWIELPPCDYGPEAISPTRDTRLRWMQSVIGYTHYVAGAGEMQYLRTEEAPDIEFVPRLSVARAEEAFCHDDD